MKPHLPQASVLCLSTLLVGSVYVLQNADHFAKKLKECDSPIAEQMAEGITVAAEYTGLAELNLAQREWLDKWIILGNGDSPEEEEESTEEPEVPQTPPQPTVVELPPAPASQASILSISDDAYDPKATDNKVALPEGITPLADTQEYPLDAPMPQPIPQPEQNTPEAPNMDGMLEPTPLPAPVIKDVSEPDGVPGTETPADTTTEQPTADTPEQETEKPEAVAQDTPKVAPPVRCKIMLMGDSLMEDLGPRTHRRLRERAGLQFILSAKYSTGLCRPDYFDWSQHMREVIPAHKPDFLVIFIGANDGQPIKRKGSIVMTGDQRWRDTYGEKMKEIIDIANANGTKVLWVGLPCVAGRYGRLVAETTKAQAENCARFGVDFIDTNPTFADENGEVKLYRKDKNGKMIRLRRQDKTHLSPEGNMVLIDEILIPALEKELISFSANHPDRCLTEEEAKKVGSAPLSVTVKYVPSTPTRKNRRRK